MNYNILESRIEFQNNRLFRITVLVEMSKGDVRAIYADTKPKSGYMFLHPNQELNQSLLQDVAAGGAERFDKDDMFPGWHSKLTELREKRSLSDTYTLPLPDRTLMGEFKADAS